MKLYVVRHGYAGDNTQPAGDPDPNLPLTQEGRDALAALAKWMKENDEIPRAVYASPLRRAQQSARILRDALGLPPVKTEDGLGPAKPLQMIVKKLAADDKNKRVLLVSHHDSIATGLRALNYLDKQDVDPIAMGELRCLDVARKDGSWDECKRVLPSDLDQVDFY